MNYTLVIKADYNDADYVSEENTIDEETLAMVKRVVAAIKAKGLRYHNWDNTWSGDVAGDYAGLLSPEDIDWFNEYIPIAPNHDGIHTIESIKIAPVVEWETLL